jgi:hypothetical protein
MADVHLQGFLQIDFVNWQILLKRKEITKEKRPVLYS